MRQDDFDKHFDGVKKTAMIGFVFMLLFNLTIIGFLIWCVIKVMQHFGVI